MAEVSQDSIRREQKKRPNSCISSNVLTRLNSDPPPSVTPNSTSPSNRRSSTPDIKEVSICKTKEHFLPPSQPSLRRSSSSHSIVATSSCSSIKSLPTSSSSTAIEIENRSPKITKNLKSESDFISQNNVSSQPYPRPSLCQSSTHSTHQNMRSFTQNDNASSQTSSGVIKVVSSSSTEFAIDDDGVSDVHPATAIISTDSPSSSPHGQHTVHQNSNENTGGNTNKNKAQSPDDSNEKTSKDYYFDSYSHHGIHEEMLKDEVRTRTYQMAILNNAHLFKDKVVLDVGCGTGILCMFAAQAGARHVYGVDCSSIINQASQIIECNGFQDKITLIKGKVEDIELPVPTVDIIVSEWMGYFLLYESMLDTVLFARDKWLTPHNGIIFPDKAVMYICAMEDAQVKHERIDFWDNVYGFDMSPIKELAYQEPVVDIVDSKSIVSNCQPILHIDILTCTKEELSFCADFKLRATRNDYVHGFVAYFECAFTQVHKPLGFSTSPYSKYTHWKQTIFYMKDVITICEGEEIRARMKCKPNGNNPRDLDIALEVGFSGRHSQLNSSMDYKLR